MTSAPDRESQALRILVVDDEKELRDMVREYLLKQGHTVHCAPDSRSARDLILRETVDVALVDIRMPGEDGISLVRHLRENHEFGVIMVTAADEAVDRIVGLEVGADDYVVKPFDPRELLARIRSVSRRVRRNPAGVPMDHRRVRFGNCILDLNTQCLTTLDNQEISISDAEFATLKVFAENPNRVLSREQLLAAVHERSWDADDRSIDIRITRLRRKVEEHPDHPRAIRTVRRAGYMFVPHQE